MHIHVSGNVVDGSQQTRAYVEYRVFSAVARSSPSVADARVTVGSSAPGEHVRCTIEVRLRSGRVLRSRGRALHPYPAVDCAAQRMRHALERHARAVQAS